MPEPIATLEIRWNGITLEARPTLEIGWEKLVGPRAFGLTRTKVMCEDASSLTPFELGMFLATACRPFTEAWDREAPQSEQQRMLFVTPDRPDPALPG
jgi:hypothetical protein